MSDKKMCSRKLVPSRYELAEKVRDYARVRKMSCENVLWGLENSKHPIAQTILREVRQYARDKKIGFVVALGRIINTLNKL